MRYAANIQYQKHNMTKLDSIFVISFAFVEVHCSVTNEISCATDCFLDQSSNVVFFPAQSLNIHTCKSFWKF